MQDVLENNLKLVENDDKSLNWCENNDKEGSRGKKVIKFFCGDSTVDIYRLSYKRRWEKSKEIKLTYFFQDSTENDRS